MYLAKHTICDIGDRVIADAFRQIGDKWECKELEPYEERRNPAGEQNRSAPDFPPRPVGRRFP
jgi:hypothetical protein